MRKLLTTKEAREEFDRLRDRDPEDWGTVHRETAWLVEMIQPEENPAPCPRWWHPGHNLGWVWDANKALRFAREADAADYIASQTFLHGKPTEHVFIGAPSEHHQREDSSNGSE